YLVAPSNTDFYSLSLHDALPISFDTRRLQSLFYAPWGWPSSKNSKRTLSEDLLNTACNLGFEEEDVMILQGCGYCPDEIEELLRSEEHTSEFQSRFDLVCCLLLE